MNMAKGTKTEEAIEALDSVIKNYDDHCVAARQLAAQYFDSDKVLKSMLLAIGA